MTNTKLFLLIGTSLSLIPTITFAQCVATQDCATLGYTESSCAGGNGVKCPFGNKWACFKSETECEQQFCEKYGFTQTCTGTGYLGSAGLSCNGKYAQCLCSSGYVWKASSQKCEYTCEVGWFYYSDGTCSSQFEDSKTLLGVIIYPRDLLNDGWVITIKPIATRIKWSSEFREMPEEIYMPSGDYKSSYVSDSCVNTDIIASYGDSTKYPAVWKAKNYKPEGTPNGKSWCLPSGILLYNALGKDSSLFTKINESIAQAGGIKIGYGGNGDGEYMWSSNAYDYSYDSTHYNDGRTAYAYGVYSLIGWDGVGGFLGNRNKTGGAVSGIFVVRPVMAF